MKDQKRRKLEASGWKVGSAAEFLGLSAEEQALIEMKLALARGLKQRRQRRRLTQTQLARVIGSSQSRVAKMEAADATVSIDLLVRALLSLGATKGDVAKIIGSRRHRQAA
jgi:DNA-binding XRE family transcriptional regulator